MGTGSRDHWARWLDERRHGGDADQREQLQPALERIRDRVLAGAALSAGLTVLDVGCGDGLIGFAALDAVAPDGVVVFSDVSEDLLARCRTIAEARRDSERCRFVRAPAADLRPLEDGSVDRVTVRSVLIYEHDKAGAFAEFRRVLRPGGRLCLFEPLNTWFADQPDHWGPWDAGAVADLAARVRDVYAALQPRGTDPMLNFTEHDLVRLAEEAGFAQVHLDVVADVEAPQPQSWDVLLRTAPNPQVPTYGEAIAQALTTEEVERFTTALRPPVEAGRGSHRMAGAYLWATP